MNRTLESGVLLTIDGAFKSFGGVHALDGIDLEIQRGLTGFIGPNGSGKTTLFNSINGGHRLDRGRIVWGDEDIARRSVPQRARLGIASAPQNPSVFGPLTVRNNVRIAVEAAERLAKRRGDRQSAPREVDELLEQCHLADLADSVADDVSYGHQRLVNVAIALAIRPLILMLDEPGAGLNDDDKRTLAEIVRPLPGDGISVLLIEHDVPFLFGLCDRIVVLNAGQVIAHDVPHVVRSDQEVVRVYLG